MTIAIIGGAKNVNLNMNVRSVKMDIKWKTIGVIAIVSANIKNFIIKPLKNAKIVQLQIVHIVQMIYATHVTMVMT